MDDITSVANPGDYIKRHIRTVPDWPAPGVQFRDITPLLANPRVFRVLIDQFVHRYFDVRPSAIAGLDARGFIIGSVLAYELNVGFVPIRKPGKLPHETVSASYELEYGTDTLQIHRDAIRRGQKVLLVDDLLATGGTMSACCQLVEQLGGSVAGCAFVIELAFLKGREKLNGHPVTSLVRYE